MVHQVTKKHFYIFTGTLLTLLGISFFYKSTNKKNSFVFAIDSQFSERTRCAINYFITSHANLTNESLYYEVKKRFPSIDYFSIRSYDYGIKHISITAAKPLFNINDHLVFTDNNEFVSRSSYDLTNVCLPLITANKNSLKDMAPWLKNLSPELLETFAIHWTNRFHVELSHKKQLFVCSADSVLQVLSLYEKINEELQQKGTSAQTRWVIDTRFEKQLIVSTEKKGGRHG